jgi:hypothetical protein
MHDAVITLWILAHNQRCAKNNIIFKNGHNKSGNPQFRCKDGGRSSIIKPKIKYTDEKKELIMRRLFGVAPATLTSWIKKPAYRSKPRCFQHNTQNIERLKNQ